nr:DUF6369 family protein [uncultured Allomuricauda sp.]
MIPSVIFVFFILLYLVLGLLFWRTKRLKWFLLISLLMPFTPSLTVIHTKYQITVYFFFVTVPVLLYTLTFVKKNRISKNIFCALLILPIFFLVYTCLGYVFNPDPPSMINLLKDAKPILGLTIGLLFLDIMKGNQLSWESKLANKFLLINFFATIFYFLLVNFTPVVAILTNDPFYVAQESRYLSLGTFYAVFFLVGKMASNSKINGWQFIFVFGPIFLSGNRTLLLVTILLFFLNVIMSMSNPKVFLRKAGLLFVGLLAVIVGILSLNETLKARVSTLLNVKVLLTELEEKRFSPFFFQLDKFEWYNYLIGKGAGETFFIPWFEYRKNIDNYNVYMDNIYLTLFVKYGLGMLVPLLILLYFINKTETNKRFKALTICYFLIMGLTTSYMYQTSFLFILVLLAGFKTSKTAENGMIQN